MSKLDLTSQLADQLVGKHFGPQPHENYDKPTNIVVAGNGVFRVVKTPIALFTTQVSTIPAAQALPGIAGMTEGPELTIPKIPLKYLIMILTWYRDIYEKDKTEASVLFFWNHNEVELPTHWEPTAIQKTRGEEGDPIKGLVIDGQLVVYCPKQKNSGTLSEFHQDTLVPYLRQHCTPLCESHSHHSMDAYFSGTDNANENMTQFYGVWGKIDKDEPKFAFRWVCGDKKVECDPSILFDIPQVEIKTTVTTTLPVEGFVPSVQEKVEYKAFKGPWQRVEAPEDWMGQHTKSWGSSYYQKNTGGATTAGGAKTTSGYDRWPTDRNYDDYDDGYYGGYPGAGYSAAGGAKQYGGTHGLTEEAKKKMVGKEVSSPDLQTSVQVFLEKTVGEESVLVAEQTVREIIKEIIDYGYDNIISDTMLESSGYGHLHTDYDIYS